MDTEGRSHMWLVSAIACAIAPPRLLSAVVSASPLLLPCTASATPSVVELVPLAALVLSGLPRSLNAAWDGSLATEGRSHMHVCVWLLSATDCAIASPRLLFRRALCTRARAISCWACTIGCSRVGSAAMQPELALWLQRDDRTCGWCQPSAAKATPSIALLTSSMLMPLAERVSTDRLIIFGLGYNNSLVVLLSIWVGVCLTLFHKGALLQHASPYSSPSMLLLWGSSGLGQQ